MNVYVFREAHETIRNRRPEKLVQSPVAGVSDYQIGNIVFTGET